MEKSTSFRERGARRYVDILTNGGFKALFGDVNNKEAVISIINVLLPEHRRVVDIDYQPTEHQGPVQGKNKEYHYDFMCRDVSGAVFIVELQCYNEEHWFKRCVSYASRVYDRQNSRGKGYDIPPVYLIGLMGIDIGHEDPKFWEDRYISEYTFREKSSHELLDETIVIIFAELARFSKNKDECVDDVDRMLYVLKNMGDLDHQPDWLHNEVYSRIFDACEIAGFTEDKRTKYDKDMYDEKRLQGEYAAYQRMGLEAGLKEGRAEIIRSIHAKGISAAEIGRMLDMDVSEIERILSENS